MIPMILLQRVEIFFCQFHYCMRPTILGVLSPHIVLVIYNLKSMLLAGKSRR